MSQIYPIKIADTGDTFYPRQQSGKPWNDAVERAHRNTHAICLCLGDSNSRKLAIKRVGGDFVFARYQDTSHHHLRKCQFYGPSRTQSGLQGYTQEAVREHPEGGLAITLARGLQAPLQAADKESRAATQRYAGQSVRRNTMRLGGLIDLLWEEARLNRWDSSKPKYWDLRVGTALLREAEKIHIGHLTLDQALLLPAQRSDRPKSLTSEHQRNLKVVAYGREHNLRLIAISPLAQFDPVRDSWANVSAGIEAPAQRQEQQLRLGTPYGIPQLMLDAARSAAVRRSYGIEVAAWKEHKKVYAITQIALREGSPDMADVLDVSLLFVSNRFIPLDSSYEGQLEEVLVKAQRSFIKPMRYETEDEVFPDFWLQDMGCEYPMEVFGMNTDDYLKRKENKHMLYSDRSKYPNGWWYWDVPEQSLIPPLPAPVIKDQ